VPLTNSLSTKNSTDLLLSKDSSVNLIQKAHDLYSQKYPQKVISIGSKPLKAANAANDLDLPTIDEAE
jgi:hypothetical protein